MFKENCSKSNEVCGNKIVDDGSGSVGCFLCLLFSLMFVRVEEFSKHQPLDEIESVLHQLILLDHHPIDLGFFQNV